MKKLCYFLSLLFITAGYAQDTIQTGITGENDEMAMNSMEHEIPEPTWFLYEEQEYIFTPDELGYKIQRLENGNEIDFGTLRKTSNDGFYIMTSMENDESSFGRFNEEGDFRALRYDIENDTVKEENFINKGTGKMKEKKEK